MSTNSRRGQPIRQDEIYDLQDFAQRVKFGRVAMRSARKGGLKVVKVGNNRYVRGVDWAAYVAIQVAKQYPC